MHFYVHQIVQFCVRVMCKELYCWRKNWQWNPLLICHRLVLASNKRFIMSARYISNCIFKLDILCHGSFESKKAFHSVVTAGHNLYEGHLNCAWPVLSFGIIWGRIWTKTDDNIIATREGSDQPVLYDQSIHWLHVSCAVYQVRLWTQCENGAILI